MSSSGSCHEKRRRTKVVSLRPSSFVVKLPSGLCEALVHFVPVYGVPPGGQVIGPAVLVLKVIGVLPNVVAEDREAAVGHRVVLVGGADDSELAVASAYKPGPATAESLDAGVIELCLEGVKVAEGLIDGTGDRTCRSASSRSGP